MPQTRVELHPDVIDRTPPSARNKGAARVLKNCVTCGQPYLIGPHIAWRYSTCSRDCSTKRREQVNRVHPMTKICDLCGKEFRNRGVGQGRTRRFCSNECRLAHLNALPRARKPEGVFFSAQTTPRGYIRGQIWRDGKVINIMEHRWVMEQHLGRRLTAKERVHHVNGNRTDNRIENLELFASQGEHLRHCHDHEIRENLEKARVGYLAFLSNSQSSTA